MADDLAYESIWNESDRHRKEQVKARRTSSIVKDFAVSPYLCDDEVLVLKNAASILEQLVDAAEISKKKVKQQEKIRKVVSCDEEN